MNAPIRMIQLTDMHLFADAGATLLGLNTEDSFQAVLSLVKQEQSNIDLFVITGDISQDPLPETYARFNAAMSQFERPYYCIQGNHDLTVPFDAADAGAMCGTVGVVDFDGWTIILLNSSIDGKVEGLISNTQLDWLRQTLLQRQNKHVLIATHHNPLPVGCIWLDQHMIQNAHAFWGVLKDFDQVRGVMFGHVHQVFEQVHMDVAVFSAPSTCIQFKPNCADFSLDELSAGYRFVDLCADGRIETGVSRVSCMPQGTQLGSKGY